MLVKNLALTLNPLRTKKSIRPLTRGLKNIYKPICKNKVFLKQNTP